MLHTHVREIVEEGRSAVFKGHETVAKLLEKAGFLPECCWTKIVPKKGICSWLFLCSLHTRLLEGISGEQDQSASAFLFTVMSPKILPPFSIMLLPGPCRVSKFNRGKVQAFTGNRSILGSTGRGAGPSGDVSSQTPLFMRSKSPV